MYIPGTSFREPQLFKHVFKHLKNFKKGAHFPPVLKNGADSAHSSRQKAHMLKQYFHSVFNTKSSKPAVPPEAFDNHPDSSFDTSFSKVTKIISNLDTSKATGADGLPPRLLKTCSTGLAKPYPIFSQNPNKWANSLASGKLHASNLCLKTEQKTQSPITGQLPYFPAQAKSSKNVSTPKSGKSSPIASLTPNMDSEEGAPV